MFKGKIQNRIKSRFSIFSCVTKLSALFTEADGWIMLLGIKQTVNALTIFFCVGRENIM
jgi:hypothetical protein